MDWFQIILYKKTIKMVYRNIFIILEVYIYMTYAYVYENWIKEKKITAWYV